MVTEKDMKVLSFHRTRMGKIGGWVLLFVPVVFVSGVVVHLKLSQMIGSWEGYTLLELFKGWGGVDFTRQYSGVYLAATRHLSSAMLAFGLGLVSAVFVYGYRVQVRRHERILNALEAQEK